MICLGGFGISFWLPEAAAFLGSKNGLPERTRAVVEEGTGDLAKRGGPEKGESLRALGNGAGGAGEAGSGTPCAMFRSALDGRIGVGAAI